MPAVGMAVDELLPVARQAMAQAGIEACQVDMIVTLSLSPDHLAIEPNIIGPRIGHPVQRALAADNAYVFDLMDASAAKALHVADVFAHQNGARHVLFLRAECTLGLEPDPRSGFSIPNGAMAMVLSPDGQSRFATTRLPDVSPLMIMVRKEIRAVDDAKATLHFAPAPEFLDRYRAAQEVCIASLSMQRFDRMVEQWPLRSVANGTAQEPGPFEFGVSMVERLASPHPGVVAAVSFDPFGPSADALMLHYGR